MNLGWHYSPAACSAHDTPRKFLLRALVRLGERSMPNQCVDPIRGAAGGPDRKIAMRIGGKGAHLILKFREPTEVMHPALLVQRRDWLCASDLSAGGSYRSEWCVRLDHSQCRFNHVAAIVHLGYDPIGPVRPIDGNGRLGPFHGPIAARSVGEHPTTAVGILAGDNDSGFVSPLGRTCGWIDSDDDSDQRRSCAGPQPFQHAAVPQGTRNILKEFCF